VFGIKAQNALRSCDIYFRSPAGYILINNTRNTVKFETNITEVKLITF
jgi:hypothetical protein